MKEFPAIEKYLGMKNVETLDWYVLLYFFFQRFSRNWIIIKRH